MYEPPKKLRIEQDGGVVKIIDIGSAVDDAELCRFGFEGNMPMFSKYKFFNALIKKYDEIKPILEEFIRNEEEKC